MFPFRISVLVLFAFFLTLPCSHPAKASNNLDEAQSIVLKSQAVFSSFMHDPNMEWFHDNVNQAYGIFIVPQMLRGGFIIGGSGGSGALLVRDRRTGTWSYPAFYMMGSLSVGLQAGADASELVLMIMTEQGLNAMLSTEIKLGADMSVAAGPVGKNAKAQTADVLAFGRSKGLFGGLSIEGAVITPRNLWNSAYYSGGVVSPVDILMRRIVSNSQAEPLRSAMPGSRPQFLRKPSYLTNNQGYETGYPRDEWPVSQEEAGTGYAPHTGKAKPWRNPDQQVEPLGY